MQTAHPVHPKETEMTRKVIAVAIAAAFAFPLAAQAQSGADRMFDALDKDKDRSLSREEVKGTPHDKDFTKLDKNSDGKLSRDEHAAAPEHAGDKPATGGTAGGASGSGSGTGGSSKKY
jgi:Ni/Co efflux regulator RcnB